MNTKLIRIALTSVFVLGAAVAAYAQDGAQKPAQKPGQKTQKAAPAPVAPATPKPVVFTTATKVTVAKLKTSETDIYDVRGKITYTITAANSDDTVAGTVNYTLPDDARQKIAAITGKPLNSVPSSFTKKDTVAGFQKMTAPPIIHLEISPMEVDVAGAKVNFNRITLDVNGRESTDQKYSNEEFETLLTVWARQIANGRPRRGIITRLNKLIAGEPEDQ
ncbi:MAG TPA: hypothetical protein VJ810_14785 [Blastocatellia bacterium]|nr:hypothetical protein [Blastocatellia bacterium]